MGPFITLAMVAAAVAGGLSAGIAAAQSAAELSHLPAEGAGGSLWPLNPAYLRTKGQGAGLLGGSVQRETVIDDSNSGGGRVDAKVKDDVMGAVLWSDLGGGAAFGLAHQLDYRQVSTSFGNPKAMNNRNQTPAVETLSFQHSEARLAIELTNELKGAAAIHYLYRHLSILGSPSLRAGSETEYKAPIFGYGGGLAYTTKVAGIGYTYQPTMRGKTSIYGEDRIVMEEGYSALDAFAQPTSGLTLGLEARKWFTDLDELAKGTTAADNRTQISLFGLDPDQYLRWDRRLALEAAWQTSPRLSLRLAGAADQATFDRGNLFSYTNFGLSGSGPLLIKTNRARLGLRFIDHALQLDAGAGYFVSSFTGSGDQPATYKSTGQEWFANLSVKL